MVEIAQLSRMSIILEENAIPVMEEVRGACEILGFDPLYIANEGRFAAFVPKHQADKATAVLKHSFPELKIRVIGKAEAAGSGQVILKSAIGSERVLDMISGDQLPRIC
jgi:hydrogenase expression/formation protein HypE